MAFLDRDTSSLLQFEFTSVGRVIIENPMSRIQVGNLDAIVPEAIQQSDQN